MENVGFGDSVLVAFSIGYQPANYSKGTNGVPTEDVVGTLYALR